MSRVPGGAAEPTESSVVDPPPDALSALAPLSTFGIGSLPHRDADDAAQFHGFDVTTLPSLPRRSPAEAPVAQALVGAAGITMGPYGSVSIDADRLDPDAPVVTEIWRDEFVGLRTSLEHAVERRHDGVVKWQFVGPVSVGVTLRRAGVPHAVAFGIARTVVRCRVRAVFELVRAALPSSPQIIVFDEPLLHDVTARDFPMPIDAVLDLLSSAMAVVDGSATVGIHTCGEVPAGLLIDAGPHLVSLPVDPGRRAGPGALTRFVRQGRHVAWGAVVTEGPIGANPAKAAQRVREEWRALARRGVDLDHLRAQSLITPQCGLGGLTPAVAERVCATTQAVASALRDG